MFADFSDIRNWVLPAVVGWPPGWAAPILTWPSLRFTMFVEFHSYIPSTGKFVPVIDGTTLKGNRYNGANNTSPFWDLPVNVSKDSFLQLQYQLHRGTEENSHGKLTVIPVEMHTVRRASGSHSPLPRSWLSSPSPSSPSPASPQGLYSIETARSPPPSCGSSSRGSPLPQGSLPQESLSPQGPPSPQGLCSIETATPAGLCDFWQPSFESSPEPAAARAFICLVEYV